MNAEELMYQLTHLTIDQMVEIVKKTGNTQDRRFRATGPKGSMEGTILDPYLGLIQFDGEEGFCLVQTLRFVSGITYELI